MDAMDDAQKYHGYIAGINAAFAGNFIHSCLHMVHRSRNTGVVYENLLHTSTARAIYYSALTTLMGFGSLVFSTHQGTAGMGLLLTIGLFLTLVCVLIILPVLLQSTGKKKESVA